MKYHLLLVLPAIAVCCGAQTAAKPKPDVLILNDEEKLVGVFERSSGSSVVFKSDLIGEVTVDWSKVKELHTANQYAVVPKGVRLDRRSDTLKVPKGSLDMTGQTITLAGAGGARSLPVAEAAHIIEATTFEKDVERTPGLTEAWGGAITAGATIVQATQQSRAFHGAIHLVRAIPFETWLPARDRTLVDFTASEGFVIQPNTPKIKTEILHAGVERDQYFSGRVYGFGEALFDHNYSQGLDLQQSYGGGLGWTAIQQADLTFDLKGSVTYTRQQFQLASSNHNLIGSIFAESLARKFPKGMILLEQISVTPAWNETRAWLATATASFTAPVYKRLSFSIGVEDDFLNDPPPGFKKNSFQATTGLTYTLR